MMIMKKIFIALTLLAGAFVLNSCEDPALSAVYGDALVYMPQAAHNIGVDNNLNVTLSKAKVDGNAEHRSQTTLGIYRSSTAPKEAFSVDLVVVPDTLAKAKVSAAEADAPEKFAIYKTAELLEDSYYEPLPEKLSVVSGERQATTQLVFHDKELYDDYPVGQVLCLPVRIANPTKYQLNEGLAFTMVVVTLGE